MTEDLQSRNFLRLRFLSVLAIALLLCAAVMANVVILAAARTGADPGRSLLSQPLAAEPFVDLALQADDAGRNSDAIALMEQALSRNPRSIQARSWLLARYVEQSRFDDAIRQADRLRVLRPEVIVQSADLLAVLAADPRSRPALASLLRRSPEWRPRLFRAMAGQGIPTGTMVQLLRSSIDAGEGRDSNEVVGLIVTQMVARGDIEGAYLTWQSFLPVSAGHGLIYDPRFAGLPGSPPFNWSMQPSGTAAAALRKDGGLEFNVVPNTGDRLAGQTLRLKHGLYRIRTKVDGAGKPAGLFWSLQCLGSPQALQFSAFEATLFEVPEGRCAAQILQLTSGIAESSEPISGVVRSVSLERIHQ